MGDIALVWDADRGAADFTITDLDLTSEEGLRSAVIVSLLTDRRAEPDDAIPGESGDLRGWWGDQFLADADDRIGSRLWLLDRSKVFPGIGDSVEAYVREALQWMIDDNAVDRIGFNSEVDGDRLLYEVLLFQGDKVIRYADAWTAEAARSE